MHTTFMPIILTQINTPWEKVYSLGVPVSFPVRRILSGCTAGCSDAGTGMYYIKRGRVRLSNLNPNGQERVVLYMGKGVLFNEIPMLDFNPDYLFTCMEAVDAVFWPKKLITGDFIREYPDLLLNLLESMGKKSRSFYCQLNSLRSFSSFANVCRTLYSMHLFNRVGERIVPELTQQELAALLGIHRSSLHKALTRLKDGGIIGSYHRKQLTIYDLPALYHYATAMDAE